MSDPVGIILSVAYLPNIQYFSKLLTYPEILIEVNDTYQKQSYRNRTTIYGANGRLDLVIPVKRSSDNTTKTRDILIDYDMSWQQTHWKAIVSAYKNSPFFEIFEPELKPFYKRREKFLLDWNLSLLDALMEMTATEIHYKKTPDYVKVPPENLEDFRETIHPKKRMQQHDDTFRPIPYFQVFSEKYGFIANLSFIDILFNEGSQAVYLCKNMRKKGN